MVKILPSIPAFRGCTAGEISLLGTLFTEASLRAGRALYAQGEKAGHVYVLLSGRIRMERETEGRTVHLGELRAGDFFGYGEMYFDGYYIGTVAEEDCRLLAMRREDFRDKALSIASVRDYVLESLSHLARRGVWMLDWAELGRQLRYLLFWLCADKADRGDGFIEIGKEYTHERIARMLNSSREHVSRSLALLRGEGILSPESRRLAVRKTWVEERARDPVYDRGLYRYFNIG